MVKSNNKNEKYIVGIILACIAIFLMYSPEIFEAKEPEQITVPLCDYAVKNYGRLDYKFIDVEKQYVNVPDYAADVYLEPKAGTFNLNSNAEFTLKVIDKGIQKLNSSYFYIFLFDPDDKLRAIFPCFCGQEELKFGIEGYSCRTSSGNDYCSIEDDGSKFEEWEKKLEWKRADGKDYHCTDKKNSFCIADLCRSRSSFLAGGPDKGEYVYSSKVDKLGTWKIHTFLFEEEYLTREFKGSYLSEFYNNVVAHSEAKFEVVNELPKEKYGFWWLLSQAIKIAFAFAAALGLSIPFYERTKSLVLKYKSQIIIFAVAFILMILLALIFCKISCPIGG